MEVIWTEFPPMELMHRQVTTWLLFSQILHRRRETQILVKTSLAIYTKIENTIWAKNCVKRTAGSFWSVFSCIRTEYRKIRTRNNSAFGHFSCSEGYLKESSELKNYLKIIETFRKRLLCNLNCPTTLGLKFWLYKFQYRFDMLKAKDNIIRKN